MTYLTIISTRGRRRLVEKTVDSLLSQTRPPKHTVIVDDSPTPLQGECGNIVYIGAPNPEYDSRRIVRNWNIALCHIYANRLQGEYLFFSGDDCLYPPRYAEALEKLFEADPLLAVASGVRGSVATPPDGFKLPEGSGRMVRLSFLQEVGGYFPELYGYEPWIAYMALLHGRRIRVVETLRYRHLGDLGGEHGFVEWGAAMRCLGYHPLFALARAIHGLYSNGDVPRRVWIRILLDYLLSPITKRRDPYYKPHNPRLRAFISEMQRERLRSLIGRSS